MAMTNGHRGARTGGAECNLSMSVLSLFRLALSLYATRSMARVRSLAQLSSVRIAGWLVVGIRVLSRDAFEHRGASVSAPDLKLIG